MRSSELAGQRAMIIGLAREGLDLTRFLTAHGASVLVTDRKPADDLKEVMGQLTGADVTYRLGGHHVEDLKGIDVVYASPGVPPER